MDVLFGASQFWVLMIIACKKCITHFSTHKVSQTMPKTYSKHCMSICGHHRSRVHVQMHLTSASLWWPTLWVLPAVRTWRKLAQDLSAVSLACCVAKWWMKPMCIPRSSSVLESPWTKRQPSLPKVRARSTSHARAKTVQMTVAPLKLPSKLPVEWLMARGMICWLAGLADDSDKATGYWTIVRYWLSHVIVTAAA